MQTLINSVGNFRSIDDFLHSYSHDEHIKILGKIGIARAISSYEYKSPVRKIWETYQPKDWLNIYEDKWVFSLVHLLITGVKGSEPGDIFRNLTLISFNYDRCVESIIFHAIQGALGISRETAANLMKTLSVYRPYGGLGDLQYDQREAGFGVEHPNLIELASRIRVYTEDLEDTPHMQRMRAALADAEAIVFLGFGFHPQNMKILDLLETCKTINHAYATVFREPAPAVSRVRELLAPLPRSSAFIGNPDAEDCIKFMRNHYMPLSG
jgi:hypothetical protein